MRSLSLWGNFVHFRRVNVTRKVLTLDRGSQSKRSRLKCALATSSQQQTATSDSSSDYPKAQRVNGQFRLPWGASRLPSSLEALKWFWSSPNNSSLPHGGLVEFFQYNYKLLDHTLPIIKPSLQTFESPPHDSLQVTWIGHATVLVQMDGLNILTDPVLNEYCGMAHMVGVKRYRPAPCTVNELPVIDAVCISHNHYDHLDYGSVCDLNERFGDTIHWFIPMGLRSWMKECGCKNVIELEWWDEQLHPKCTDKSVKFVFTPAQHWCRRGLNDVNQVLWGSWTIIGAKHRFFFAGDSGYCQIFKQIGKRYGPFDLAAIPIGAYEPRGLMSFQHVNPEEAVEIHQDLKSNFSFGIHWGTFNLSYEHYLDPPKKMREALDKKGISKEMFCTLRHGETKIVRKIKEQD